MNIQWHDKYYNFFPSDPFTLTGSSYRVDFFDNSKYIQWSHILTGDAASCNSSNYSLSLTPALPPSNVLNAGDILIMYAKGAHSEVSQRWDPPVGEGWTEIGEPLAVDTGPESGARYNSMQMWWKVAGENEQNPTVTIASSGGGGGDRGWTAEVSNWRIATQNIFVPEVAFVYDDYAGDPAYSYGAYVGNQLGTVVTFVAAANKSGNLNTIVNESNFLELSSETSMPTSKIFSNFRDDGVAAASQPIVGVTGQAHFMSKTFSLVTLPPAGEGELTSIYGNIKGKIKVVISGQAEDGYLTISKSTGPPSGGSLMVTAVPGNENGPGYASLMKIDSVGYGAQKIDDTTASFSIGSDESLFITSYTNNGARRGEAYHKIDFLAGEGWIIGSIFV